jgi:hypothetical protein
MLAAYGWPVALTRQPVLRAAGANPMRAPPGAPTVVRSALRYLASLAGRVSCERAPAEARRWTQGPEREQGDCLPPPVPLLLGLFERHRR